MPNSKKQFKIAICAFVLLFIAIQKLKAQADFKADNYIFTDNYWKDSSKQNISPQPYFKLYDLPILTKIQWVQDHPYNWNDGAMVPAKGWQQYARVGINAQWKFLELQIAPEMVNAQNQQFESFPLDADPVIWRDYYRFYNFIELPERMGDKQYSKVLLGQSFIKLHYKKWSLGLSTANQWWGPAQRNALLLSTTAAGFPHINIVTDKPLATKIGKFNIDIMAGKVTNGGWEPPGSFMTYRGNPLYVPKNQVWKNVSFPGKNAAGEPITIYQTYKGIEDKTRLITGVNISYQPKWFSNLTIGFEQTYMLYEKDMNRWQDYLPIKNILTSIPYNQIEQPITLTGFYFNYEMPKAHTSFYGEVGWNLNNTSFRNWILQPDKGYASTWGFKKTFLTQHNYNWELLGELTQTQLLTRAEQFSAGVPPSWYLGSNIRQGYTHDGQLIGAGVGPGGSSQTIEFNWRENKNRIGFTFERREHNSDFLEYAYYNSQDFRRFYVDFVSTLKVDWTYKNMTVGPRISYMQTNNYEWNLYQTVNTYFIPGRDVQQWMGQLNIQYHF